MQRVIKEVNYEELGVYSEKIKACYVQYEYFVDRNKQLDKMVMRIEKKLEVMNNLPNFLLIFRKKNYVNLIKLYYIVLESIDKNHNYMIELQVKFNNVLKKLESCSYDNDIKAATQMNILLNEYWEFKKLLNEQINISFELKRKLSLIQNFKKSFVDSNIYVSTKS